MTRGEIENLANDFANDKTAWDKNLAHDPIWTHQDLISFALVMCARQAEEDAQRLNESVDELFDRLAARDKSIVDLEHENARLRANLPKR